MELLNKLSKEKLIHPPTFLYDSCFYMTRMGSVAYGVSTDYSDEDFYGFCIPPVSVLFPHTNNELYGWDFNTDRFEQWQKHGVQLNDVKYDFNIYNIVKYFRLCANCNPNMIDSLFTKRNDVVQSTAISELVRDNRHLFLSKRVWFTYRGFAYQELGNLEKGKEGRQELIDRYGFDTKNAYHIVRLIDEAEQILTTHDLDLHRAKEHMKAVREGRVSLKEIKEWFSSKEQELPKILANSSLPEKPREKEIKDLLLRCIEMHYGSIDKYIVNVSKERELLMQIAEITRGY